MAVADLASDICRISGQRPTHKHFLPRGETGYVLVGSIQNPALRRILSEHNVDVSALEGQWEHYRIQTFGDDGENLLLCGSDERGAMWAVYEFAETFLGVDPVGFWTDHEPASRERLTLDATFHEDAPHTFRFRGWFLNDEDLLCEWKSGGGKRTIDYSYYHDIMHPDVMAAVLETALRLKQNLMIPASFLDIANPAEENLVRMAAERGLFVSQHHIEPMGVSHFALEDYWKAKGDSTPPSFVTDKEKLIETWQWYAEKWAQFGDRVIWQLGLRGRGDRAVWVDDPNVPESAAARGKLISDAIACQHEIVAKVTGRSDFVSSSTLWSEGTDLHNAGHLVFPPDTVVVFADRVFQWGEDFHTVERRPGGRYGIYYHVAVWGRGPHLVQGVPLDTINTCFQQALEKGDTTYAITNVTNIREVIMGVSAVARLSWNTADFSPQTFLDSWCRQQFPAHEDAAVDLYRAFDDAHCKFNPDDFPHTILYHDGAIRSVGVSLLRLLFSVHGLEIDATLSSSGSGRIDSAKPSIDKAPILVGSRRLQPLATASLPRWRAIYRHARTVAATIAPQRKTFFCHHFLTQTEIMIGLTEWALALSHAAESVEAKQPPTVTTAHIDDACHALTQLLTSRERSETGKWTHWYRGDRKINVNYLQQQTLFLLEYATGQSG